MSIAFDSPCRGHTLGTLFDKNSRFSNGSLLLIFFFLYHFNVLRDPRTTCVCSPCYPCIDVQIKISHRTRIICVFRSKKNIYHFETNILSCHPMKNNSPYFINMNSFATTVIFSLWHSPQLIDVSICNDDVLKNFIK